MADKKYKGAPFGIQTARFNVSGIHPKSMLPGTCTQKAYNPKAASTKLGPGTYEVDIGGFSAKAIEEKASGPGWARAYEVSRMAALPHLLHKEQWEMKRLLKRKLGPGSYEIKDFLSSAEEKPRSTRGIVQARELRFKDTGKMSETPGPGTYGVGGVPHAAIEEKEKKSTSTVGLLDAGSSNARSLPMVGSELGPGNYNFLSFTDEAAKKVTSLRGPYDTFTGDRNKPIRVGYFAAPDLGNLGPGQYAITSCVDEMMSNHKRMHGRFGKMVQYPIKPKDRIYAFTLSQMPRDPDEPGPGYFDPKPCSRSLSQAKKSPGFLSSAQRNDRHAQKFFTRNFNPVGAGRYDIQKWEEAQHLNGHQSVFKSKSGTPSYDREKFLRERIRGKDLKPSDRVFLVDSEYPENYHLVRNKTCLNSADPHTEMIIRRALTVA